MIISRTNTRMQELCPQGLAVPRIPLPPEMVAALDSGTVEIGECVFLRSLLGKAHVSRDDFPDATGYECFVNHIHIDDYCTTDMIPLAIAFLDELSANLRCDHPNRCFQAIITTDGSTCAVRFHVVRPSEEFLADDLDEYEEGVWVLDL